MSPEIILKKTTCSHRLVQDYKYLSVKRLFLPKKAHQEWNLMAMKNAFLVGVSLLALIVEVYCQSQFLRWCVAENGICHRDRECCDKMTCSDHFGVGTANAIV
ncbi:hypothetical protein pdam_00001893 [Pocillopora damicornis]|uniref:Uncharacterized protein n=1 Tax=Pocillopora damicornis TaxID=46731 RepID=A0A3M6TQ67_POCDA|nr:hypothetical protein pdam_00001893 [Pocillopora damicornis]